MLCCNWWNLKTAPTHRHDMSRTQVFFFLTLYLAIFSLLLMYLTKYMRVCTWLQLEAYEEGPSASSTDVTDLVFCCVLYFFYFLIYVCIYLHACMYSLQLVEYADCPIILSLGFMHIFFFAFLYIVSMYICMYVYIYIYIYVCTYMYI